MWWSHISCISVMICPNLQHVISKIRQRFFRLTGKVYIYKNHFVHLRTLLITHSYPVILRVSISGGGLINIMGKWMKDEVSYCAHIIYIYYCKFYILFSVFIHKTRFLNLNISHRCTSICLSLSPHAGYISNRLEN